MTEDEHIAPSEPPQPPRRELVQWQRTGRGRERAALFGSFAVGLLIGALLIAGADRRDRIRELWS